MNIFNTECGMAHELWPLKVVMLPDNRSSGNEDLTSFNYALINDCQEFIAALKKERINVFYIRTE